MALAGQGIRRPLRESNESPGKAPPPGVPDGNHDQLLSIRADPEEHALRWDGPIPLQGVGHRPPQSQMRLAQASHPLHSRHHRRGLNRRPLGECLELFQGRLTPHQPQGEVGPPEPESPSAVSAGPRPRRRRTSSCAIKVTSPRAYRRSKSCSCGRRVWSSARRRSTSSSIGSGTRASTGLIVRSGPAPLTPCRGLCPSHRPGSSQAQVL